MADNPFEIPQGLRDVSEKNLKQAHAAYEQLMDVMTKAVGAWTGALPSNPMAAGPRLDRANIVQLHEK